MSKGGKRRKKRTGRKKGDEGGRGSLTIGGNDMPDKEEVVATSWYADEVTTVMR